ncbi:YjeF domain containing protein [Moelleriella libera RCEF 2490]|uniref:ATP-dependent (S)-NAD(P)H-hydrate dehydratase n=1 Tax=Moelleriella libera RCEF 2490 TaxID=1081109 RepID=A0A168B277_9HYPO|nr:YjeF domain containing protein [Moelleriella libera RCEF 2490]
MSASTRAVLGKVRQMIPPMLDKFHKGQLGRVAVIGGSQDYTGAPYFSSMASAKLGCDMSHVICTPEAGAVIKTYSPNLMVHPLMRQSPTDGQRAPDAKDISSSIIEMLPRLHVLVVGPGLGRDPLMQETVSRVIRAAREKKMPVVLDADALQLVQKDPEVVKGYREAVLTPNVVEFGRLWDSLHLGGAGSERETDKVERLAKALGGVTVVQKGSKDFISNGETTLVDDLEGGKKRSGGQGDTLTGSIATFLAWRRAYLDKLWDVGEDAMGPTELLGLAAFGGSAITRECSRLAFLKKGRSLQASDLTEEIHTAFLGLFGEVDGEASEAKL